MFLGCVQEGCNQLNGTWAVNTRSGKHTGTRLAGEHALQACISWQMLPSDM